MIKYEKVSMTRKCHNHTLKTNPGYHEKETQNTNSHMTARRQLIKVKQPASLFNPLLHDDAFEISVFENIKENGAFTLLE